MSYQVRVVLDGIEPPVWRQLEVPSDLTLDRLHDVLQVAVGWTDSHLHQFASSAGIDDPRAERYLMLFSIDDGMLGVDERTVRLDEVLTESADVLWYEYDFGDGWTHGIRLEQVSRQSREQHPSAASRVRTPDRRRTAGAPRATSD